MSYIYTELNRQNSTYTSKSDNVVMSRRHILMQVAYVCDSLSVSFTDLVDCQDCRYKLTR